MHNLFFGVKRKCSSVTCCQYAIKLLQIIFTVLIDAISTVGKNGQQILSLILKQIKINAKLLTSFTTSGRVESSLINHVQVRPTLLTKLFIDEVWHAEAKHDKIVEADCLQGSYTACMIVAHHSMPS